MSRQFLTSTLAQVFRSMASFGPDLWSRGIAKIGYKTIKTIRPVNETLFLSKRVRIKGNSFDVILDLTKKSQSLQYLKKIYQPEITNSLVDFLKPGAGAFIDVGAHVGYYTLLASQSLPPSDPIFAFEPDAENRSALVHNLSINRQSKRVTVLPFALSDTTGKAVLNRNPLNEGGHSLNAMSFFHDDREAIEPEKVREKFPEYEYKLEVDKTTLDDFMKRQGPFRSN